MPAERVAMPGGTGAWFRCSPDRQMRVDVNQVPRHVTAKLFVCGANPKQSRAWSL
jgi:hypothetical protein